MKFTSIFLLSCLVFLGCTEIPPIVPALGDRKVLIEEFSGVLCVNCPAGASEIANLKSIYGDRLVVVSLHAGIFSQPYPDSKHDFRTTEGTALEGKLGAPLGYPSAVINRKKFAGQSELQVGRAQWAGLIAEESKQPSLANLAITRQYNAATRQLQVTVKIVATANQKLPNDLRLSAMITENDLIDPQETPQGKKTDYTHQHVLRAFAANELPVTANQELSFSTTLKTTWKETKCHLVVVLHGNDAAKEVVQVAELAIY